jgi:hypothetical protein
MLLALLIAFVAWLATRGRLQMYYDLATTKVGGGAKAS